jgi:hypothetical protein
VRRAEARSRGYLGGTFLRNSAAGECFYRDVFARFAGVESNCGRRAKNEVGPGWNAPLPWFGFNWRSGL